LEAERTFPEHRGRTDVTRLTLSRPKPYRHFAAQQAPDLTLASALCCRPD
jgi:hypothetical protein